MVLSSRRTRLHFTASRIHKWLALVIGAQPLIWFASGVIMSFLPIDKVRGEHLVDRDAVVTIPAGTRFVDAARIRAQLEEQVEAINWHMMGSRAVAEVTTAKDIKLFDAQTGELIPNCTKADSDLGFPNGKKSDSMASLVWRTRYGSID